MFAIVHVTNTFILTGINIILVKTKQKSLCTTHPWFSPKLYRIILTPTNLKVSDIV